MAIQVVFSFLLLLLSLLYGIRFPKLRVAASEQLYSFLLLLPPLEDRSPKAKERQQAQQCLAFGLQQQQIDAALEFLIATPWVQLPPPDQQQRQQKQQHPCMQLVRLLDLEAEWEDAGLPSF